MGSYSNNDEHATIALPTASLETIHFGALSNENHTESERLLSVCRNDGIFYLDMTGVDPELEEIIEDIYSLEGDLFRLPKDELMAHDIDKLSQRKLNGYKPLGRNRGGLEDGKDGFESYAVRAPQASEVETHNS